MIDTRRGLPSVGKLIETSVIRNMMMSSPRSLVMDAVRAAINDVRLNPDITPENEMEWGTLVKKYLDKMTVRSLRPVINATGVIVHTNLGRAPLATKAINALTDIAYDFSNLEYDIDTGVRGSRHTHCAKLLCKLTGAEDAIVVNNCAAALVLTLNTLSQNKEAIISRGELVEIGGSFRVPDIMARSNAQLVEVGTTNRTHLKDYENAITPNTGAILSVHRSNFVQKGFVSSVLPHELVPLAEKFGVPLIHDFGSGLMVDLSEWGLYGEPTIKDAVRDGASVVMMSGDKLLGGPQAGIILGKKSIIKMLKENPLARAFRVDKLTLAALEATLELYYDKEIAVSEIPVLRMITESPYTLHTRAINIVDKLVEMGYNVSVVDSEATIGGGAFPDSKIDSIAISINDVNPNEIDRKLRELNTPIVGRIVDNTLLLDIRTVPSAYDDILFSSLVEILTLDK
jgi:L-seryl-tRNA(Ser) seleniumtransferase